MIQFLRMIFDREIPDDETVWHRYHLFFPARTIDCGWAMAVWRRRCRFTGRVEYKAREETEEEWYDRQ